MDESGFPACPGEAATVEELHRVALTVALAISNPCKWLQPSEVLLTQFGMQIKLIGM